MPRDEDLDALMEAYCEGLYAIDPRTTFPFWDYDIAPLFSRQWIDKMLMATASFGPIEPGTHAYLLGGPSVPRKELIYSLVDMKVAGITRADRLRLASFWIELLKAWCGSTWLSTGANRAPDLDRPEDLLAGANWVSTDQVGGAAIGRMVATLNALAYGLYSDVFVHQCAECRGPYEVTAPQSGDGSRRPRLLVRSWSGLRPHGLRPGCEDPGFDQIVIAAVYHCHFSIDIYNHVTWAEPPTRHVSRYAILLDGRPVVISPEELTRVAHRIAMLAETAFRSYRLLGFEEKKVLWVRQRNYQFRKFFAFAGLPQRAPEMEAAVTGRPLERSPMWNMTLPREQLFNVWKQCLDPRTDIYYHDWPEIFHQTFGDRGRS